jgi:hypothetical protein
MESKRLLVLFVVIATIGGFMADNFKRNREWPILIKIAREYNLNPEETLMLLAIRSAEQGPKGYEFGVKAARGSNLETQARWTAGSIKANKQRYNQLMQEGVFEGDRRTIGIGLEKDIKLSEEEEREFAKWYVEEAAKRQLNINPDDPKHFYAYRKFWKAMTEGKAGTEAKHFPSEFKIEGHMSPQYAAVKGGIDFPEFMAYYGGPTGLGWAPVHDPNMPGAEVNLNKNWARNVRSLMTRYEKEFKERGIEE